MNNIIFIQDAYYEEQFNHQNDAAAHCEPSVLHQIGITI